MKRKKVRPEVQAEVLASSRRRCCICFGLDRDLQIKKGQIAHLDHDPANNHEENLAFFCFDHHDAYDSRSSQSKGFTIEEVKKYREELHGSVIALIEGSKQSTSTAGRSGLELGVEGFDLKSHRSRETHAAILEVMTVKDFPVRNLNSMSHRIGLSIQMIENAMFELSELGHIRIDRKPGTLRKTYSLTNSLVNRLLDSFVSTLSDTVSDVRHLHDRGIDLDAIVRTSSSIYAVETLFATEQISSKWLDRRASALRDAVQHFRLGEATGVLLIGISGSTSAAADVRPLEDEGLLIRYVEMNRN